MTARLLYAALLLLAAGMLTARPLAPVPPGPDDELHVVALYEGATKTGDTIHGGKAAVKVDRPGKTVTLVVTAYEPITWDVTATPKTKLDKVIFGGHERQAANVPAGVQVVEAFREGREKLDSIRFPHSIDRNEFRPAVQALHRMTGKEIASFQGTYRFDPDKPLVVDAVQKDERLSSTFPKVAAKLPKIKFQAVRATPDRFGFLYTYGEFTENGPDLDSLKPLPKNVSRLTFDPVGKKYYGIANHHEVHEVDLDKQTTTKLDPGLKLPRISWPGGITYDTKRARVVLATFGGAGYLYTFDPKTGAWAVPADLKYFDSSALAYHPKDDTLYGLAPDPKGGSGRGVPLLTRYNAKGAILKQSTLGGPMFPGVLGDPVNTHVQMTSAGNHLAVLVVRQPRDGNGKPGKGESFLFLIDPKTDKVTLTWKE